MKFSRLLATSALATALLGAPAAMAEDAPFSVSGSVVFTTDYVFRGFTQTDEKPAVQAALTITSETGLFAGIWGSNVDFADGGDASAEIDLSIGYTNSVDAFTYTVVGLYYAYPGGELAPGAPDYDYFEAGLSVSYDAGMVVPSAAVYWSPDFFLESGDAWYLTGGLAVPVTEGFKVYGNVGVQTIDTAADDITDWNIGATLSAAGFDFDLKYIDTDTDNNDFADERIVFTLTKAF